MDCRGQKMGEVLPSPKLWEETSNKKDSTASLQHFPDKARGPTITALAAIPVITRPRERTRRNHSAAQRPP